MLNNLPRSAGNDGAGIISQEMRGCSATRINTLQHSWCDYRNQERKYLNTESPGHRLFISPPSLSSHSKVFPSCLSDRPSPSQCSPTPTRFLQRDMRGAVSDFWLLHPLFSGLHTHKQKQKHPYSPRTQRTRHFFLFENCLPKRGTTSAHRPLGNPGGAGQASLRSRPQEGSWRP